MTFNKKLLIGICTFGLHQFTELAINSVISTVKETNYDILLIIGKPGDTDSIKLAEKYNTHYIIHQQNMGFPYSINDMYDFAWKDNDYKYLVIMGNDVIAYPHAIDLLVRAADDTNYDWLCSNEYNVKNLVHDYPVTGSYFTGKTFNYKFGSGPCWEYFNNYSDVYELDDTGMSDTHNLSLYSKGIFDKIGYIDVNFFPAYFEDNDLALRAKLGGVTSATVRGSVYFHFWSRAIHQGSGGSTNTQFGKNRDYYIRKWGGLVGQERYNIPFNGIPSTLQNGAQLCTSIKIEDRTTESQAINYWR